MRLKVGIVGPRRRTDRDSVTALVNSLPEGSEIVSGGCNGVDSWAASAARNRGLSVGVWYPDFSHFEILSYEERCQRYYDRNKKIAELPDIIHAFASLDRRGGTENTIKWARQLGVEVVIHLPGKDRGEEVKK